METENVPYSNIATVKELNLEMLKLIKKVEGKTKLISILTFGLVVSICIVFFLLLSGHVHFWNYCSVSVSSSQQ